MGDVYWELIDREGNRLEIPPEAVEIVKKRWNNGDPVHTSEGSMSAKDIRYFRPTSKRYGAQPLLEAAAQAFGEPVINEDGSTAVKWVKKDVPHREFARYYSNIPAYRKIASDGSMVTVAFRLPVHEINPELVEYCNQDDLQYLK
jgi:hypothetical protein